MIRVRTAIATFVVLFATLVAVGCAKQPPLASLNCMAMFGRPGTMGLPSDIGPWTPMYLGGWKFMDWWDRCYGRIIPVKDEGPKGTTPFALHLDPFDCTWQGDIRLGNLTTWHDAILDVNWEFN